MENRSIHTDSGNLELISASQKLLSRIAYYWPMELRISSEIPEAYGLVFQRGSLEVMGVRMQRFELPESKAEKCNFWQLCSMITALPIYLKNEHSGLIIPCPYHKKKPNGLIEIGIALFLSADPDSMSKLDSDRKAVPDWESAFGEGSTAMIYDMADAIYSAGRILGTNEKNDSFGIESRPTPRLNIGSLIMHFAILGRQLIVIKSPIRDNDPTWNWLVFNGISSLPYAPMIPVKVPEVLH